MPTKQKQKKRSRPKYTSKGIGSNVDRATLKAVRAERTPADKLRFKLLAAIKGKKVKLAKENNWHMAKFDMYDRPQAE